MNNEEIARRFYRLSALMEIRGDDPFRLRSYRNAAEAIEVWPTPLKEIAEKEGVAGLQEIPGIGPKTAALLHQRFKVSSLPELKAFVEGGGLEMVDGIGPKTAERIKEALDVP
jgi:DNA polymerase (family 10)